MYIQRQVLSGLIDHLSHPEITLITGPRQSGKTTLMHRLIQHGQSTGIRTLFLDMDFEPDKIHLDSHQSLLDRLKLEFGEQPGILFIDEIQRKRDAGLFLKGIYDRQLPVKMVVTGSGSLDLREKTAESLMGRKEVFEIAPVSFAEWVDFTTDYHYSDKLDLYLKLNQDTYLSHVKHYLNYGGYPKGILEPTQQGKLRVLNEIYTSYVQRDMVSLLGIDQPDAFSRLMRILAARIGQMTDFSSLARQVGISLPTIKKYLWYAEKTFTIKTVSPFFVNRLKEITKTPVYYFADLGLRNFCLGESGNADSKTDAGFLFQNLIFLELQRLVRTHQWNLHYWRTTDGAEVDFIIRKADQNLPVEVKYTTMKNPAVTRSLRSFISTYHPAEAWVITPNYANETSIGKTRIRFLPYYELATTWMG